MRLALFDLDNTLLSADSDLEWSELLAEDGAMDVEEVRQFHREYHAGTLDIERFYRVQLAPLAREPMERLLAWRERFLSQRIVPRLSPRGRTLVDGHRRAGHELVLITATNQFFTEPIAAELGIPNLVCTQAQMRSGRFTGRVEGTPCYRAGKIEHLERWLRARGSSRETLRESWFYSDSHNDVPLLSVVDHPVCVDPDAKLARVAAERGWRVLSLRTPIEASETLRSSTKSV